MATTKTKSGRKAARKGSTRAKSGTKGRTGLDHKQESALHRGGSLAQRNQAESTIGPDADRPDEITSAFPPNEPRHDEPGRASSPMFDEEPVTGKGKTSIPGAPQPEPRGQKVKAGEGKAADEGKVQDIKSLEDLPPGSSVDIGADQITIHVDLAAGARRTFIGRDAKQALQLLNDFAETGPELFPSGLTDEEEKEAEKQRRDFDKQAAERSKADLKARGIKA